MSDTPASERWAQEPGDRARLRLVGGEDGSSHGDACLDPCPGTNLCALCAAEVRVEALLWLRDLAHGANADDPIVEVTPTSPRWAMTASPVLS